MLVLFETSAGYALFRLDDESILQKVDDIWKEFSSGDNKTLQLVSFKKYKTVAEAVSNATALSEGKLDKTLKRFLKKSITDQTEKLANSLDIKCLHNSAVSELMRSIRANVNSFLGEETAHEMNAMRLGVAHSIGRYKVKFNPEKIDTMIVQAVSLLDDLDKELNNYVMRCREWYGWHFPEVGKLIADAQAYAKCVKAIGMKANAQNADLSAILPEELAEKVRQEAEISMGTDISELDLIHIVELCDQIIELAQYRAQLHDYLKNRMNALAPNLTVLLGELIGARLVSKAGSLMALAKCPASTVQILGAEKALFRALKTKKDTPKYGIIYHAQLVTQAGQKSKGKIARKLAAKVSLATRVDALCDESLGNGHGIEARVYIEQAIKEADARGGAKKQRFSGVKQAPKGAYTFKKEVHHYDAKFDMTLKKGTEQAEEPQQEEQQSGKAKKGTKRMRNEGETEGGEEQTEEHQQKEKEQKKKAKLEETEGEEGEEEEGTRKKAREETDEPSGGEQQKGQKKKKKSKG
ncbi:hypothetical protein niasHS_014788 [Heterodera schachtii]|uniref:Nop domain-containing protein n=2 Tax=Heterodera TaxID=34509 RepID=A0ABD2IIP8_HETSC